MKKSSFLSVLLFLIFLAPVFGEIRFLSPIQGNWANKQMLVIDNPDDGDYFYSFDNSDPESFGFAYDGPVLLDVTGDIKLNVTHIGRDGRKDRAAVSFSVIQDNGYGTDYEDFIKTFYKSGILNYSAGSKLSIPENLMYTLGLPPDSYLPGTVLSLSSESVLTRLVPCTIYDQAKNIKYRFIIKNYPQNAGIYSKREVPFTITDWDTINFTDNELLFKIDSEYWQLPVASRKLDRSVSHMISWQNLAYEAGNTIEYFVLPPKPEIVKTKNEDGSFVYSINGDSSYTMSVLSADTNEYMELFPQIGADVFYGDKASGSLDIGIFANSVFQGKIITDYEIDKRPPVMPEIISTAKAFYSRDKAHIEVSVSGENDLYLALSEPYSIENSNIVYTADSSILKDISVGEFKKVKNGKFVINWGPRGNGPAYYKLQCYAKNGRNTSRIAEYSLIIDQSSYYFNESADPQNAEGTAQNPFTSFDQCYKELASVRAVTLRVKGNMDIKEKYQLNSNYEIINDGNASITFSENGSFVVKGSSVEIYDCRIQNVPNKQTKTTQPVIRLENSVLTFENCQIGIDFVKNGTFIDTFNSILNITNTIASVNGLSYSSFIASVKSRINLKSSSIASSGETCVIISANTGNVNVNNCTLSVSGHSGRVAELFGVKALFTDNKYKGNLTNSAASLKAVFTDSETVIVENGNEQYGF